MRRTVLLLVIGTAMLLALGGAALAATVGGTPDAGTVQTDGQVSAVAVSGGKVYLAGFFTHVNGVPRDRLAAVDASTGQLTGWNPGADGAVRALAASPDGSRIYAGGSFTSVGGAARNRLAAIDAATGTVDPYWTPRANDGVRAIAVRGNGVYLGGRFTRVNGQDRARLARVDATAGSLDAGWAPAADGLVRALGLSADGSRLYAGGDFATAGGSRPYLAALDPATGALYGPWTRPSAPNGPVFDLQESGGRLYSAEGGPGGALTAYDPATGASLWRRSADGDVQALAVMGGEVYAGGHFLTFSSYARQFFAAVDGATGAVDPSWAPSAYGANCSSAWPPDPCDDSVWAMEADPSRGRLHAGGDFRKVSGAPHAGFARFSYPPAGSDTTPPPETTINSGPSGTVGSSSASFAFSSSEAGSSFECSLDGALYKPCTSPQSYAGLADGSHNFSVRATDAAGNADPTPASRTWTVQSGGKPNGKNR